MSSMSYGSPPWASEPEEQDEGSQSVVEALQEALQAVREATDLSSDPQEKLSLEQITTMLQKAIAADHSAGIKALGLQPDIHRMLAKAG